MTDSPNELRGFATFTVEVTDQLQLEAATSLLATNQDGDLVLGSRGASNEARMASIADMVIREGFARLEAEYGIRLVDSQGTGMHRTEDGQWPSVMLGEPLPD